MTSKKKPNPTAEHSLIAKIVSGKFSYFIADRRPPGGSFVDDEAIIDLDATIEEILPKNPDHQGAMLECSLVCSRRYDVGPAENIAGHPSLFPITLKRNQRSVLAYLPSDAFWALQARLGSGSLDYLELTYVRPHRGTGDLTSIYLR